MAEHLVLVVEDDPTDRQLIHQAIGHLDSIELEFFDSGDDAMQRLKDCDDHGLPQLVLLDLNTPGSGGFELIAWVRNEDRLQTLPLVVFSSSSSSWDRLRAYRAGCNAYHVKPFSWEELNAALCGILAYWCGLVSRTGVAT